MRLRALALAALVAVMALLAPTAANAATANTSIGTVTSNFAWCGDTGAAFYVSMSGAQHNSSATVTAPYGGPATFSLDGSGNGSGIIYGVRANNGAFAGSVTFTFTTPAGSAQLGDSVSCSGGGGKG